MLQIQAAADTDLQNLTGGSWHVSGPQFPHGRLAAGFVDEFG
jgi:hypothetical protein